MQSAAIWWAARASLIAQIGCCSPSRKTATIGMAEKSDGSRAIIAATKSASENVARTAATRRQKSMLFHNRASTVRSIAARIEGVAQPVADQVERQHQTEYREPRPHRHPRRLAEEVAGDVQHAPPTRRRRLLAEAEKRQGRLGDDCSRDRKRRLHQDRRQDVG